MTSIFCNFRFYQSDVSILSLWYTVYRILVIVVYSIPYTIYCYANQLLQDENQDNSPEVKRELLDIVPFEVDDLSNESNEVHQMTIMDHQFDEPGTSSDKTIPQNQHPQQVSCGHINVNGETCGKILISEDDLRTHIASVHCWTCEVTVDGEQCGKSFKTLNALNTHKGAHIKDQNPVACGYVIKDRVCGNTFASVTHLKSHMKMTHYREKPSTYDAVNNSFTKDNPSMSEVDDEQCGKSFKTLNALNAYIGAQIKRKGHNPVACGYVINGRVCGDMLASVTHLKRHMNRAHYWGKPYTYDELNKTFTKDNPFDSHIKGKPYFCDKSVGDGMCGKSFKDRVLFRKHVRTHIESHMESSHRECKFVCEYQVNGEPCGKGFVSQHSLGQHIWIHRTHAIRSIKEMSPDRIRNILNTQPTTQVTFLIYFLFLIQNTFDYLTIYPASSGRKRR